MVVASRPVSTVGRQNKTMAREIQSRVTTLMAKPKRPSEKVAWTRWRRPWQSETRMGSPYEVDRQMVATPVKLLKAAEEPK